MVIVYVGMVYMSKFDIIMLFGVYYNIKYNELLSRKVYIWILLYMYNVRFVLSFIFVFVEFGYCFV